MDRLGEQSVVRAYVNGPALMKVARTYGGKQLRPYLSKLGTLDWIALRLGATADGLGLDTIVHGTPGALFKAAANAPSFSPKLLGSIPADALLSLSFKGSKNMFGGLQQNPTLSTPQFRQLAKPLKQLGRILEGENALYVRPGAGRIPEVTLVATPKANGVAILDRLVKRYAGSRPQAESVDGLPVHAMASKGFGLYYTTVDGKLVVTDQAGGIRGVATAGERLPDNSEFKATKAAADAPDKTAGLLYVDIKSSIPYGEKLAGQRIPADVARNLKPLRSAMEFAASHTHELQVSFFLRIK
jgi:hypothetical protein